GACWWPWRPPPGSRAAPGRTSFRVPLRHGPSHEANDVAIGDCPPPGPRLWGRGSRPPVDDRGDGLLAADEASHRAAPAHHHRPFDDPGGWRVPVGMADRCDPHRWDGNGGGGATPSTTTTARQQHTK